MDETALLEPEVIVDGLACHGMDREALPGSKDRRETWVFLERMDARENGATRDCED